MNSFKERKKEIENKIKEYIQALTSSPRMNDQVVHHTIVPSQAPIFGNPAKPWPQVIKMVMRNIGIDRLYDHQARAIDLIRDGKHTVLATPTASGKTLVYNLPALEKMSRRHDAKALYLFPLKALAQDQLRTFEAMASHLTPTAPRAAIYDGDTTQWFRKRIRENPPNVILTNPEMMHLSLLAYHNKWASFLARLEMVVVDEVHTYRGVMGANMAQVFRRLRRLCDYYGARPVWVFCSATVSNPAELATQLTGFDINAVTQNGAPRGRRHLVFINPFDGAAQTSILLLKAALHRRLRTIVYTQSRKLTELIALWAGSRSGRFAHQISAYRAGFLPGERREIEAKLASGELLAVISTSALELGIDIGDLDLCILVGYPGTVVSTWQRGGRVGRNGQDSALALIAGEDALDQYFMKYPQELLERESEAAVVNPSNPEILAKHLICAAAELPLKMDEPFLNDAAAKKAAVLMEKAGSLLKSADGLEFYAARRRPHWDVNLRGTGHRFNIVCSKTGQNRGEIDGFRAFKETHPGAVYLHRGNTYLVETLDLNTHTAKVTPTHVNYYTRFRSHKDTAIIEVFEEKQVLGTCVGLGRLKVTDQVTGYETIRIRGHKKINIIELDLPPQVFETVGLWFKIPPETQRLTEKKQLHFMGAIHAFEHAAIGMFPLIVMTDRNDLGGISTPLHPQVKSAAVFIYDAIPGGAGLCRQAFSRILNLLETTFKVIRQCPCETGCPSCIHSPKCGSGNRPLDKAAAIFLLQHLTDKQHPTKMSDTKSANDTKCRPPDEYSSPQTPSDSIRERTEEGREKKQSFKRLNMNHPEKPRTALKPEKPRRFGVLDLETQRSAQEVGGWHKADRMGISCTVLYDSEKERYFEFLESQTPQLITRLTELDLVIGFNIKRFDYLVLRGCSDFDFGRLPTLDILQEVHRQLGFRLSLDNLVTVTLGVKKSADGLQALRWWQQGRIREIIDYCRRDVEITKDLYLFGQQNGYLLFKNKAQKKVRVPVNW